MSLKAFHIVFHHPLQWTGTGVPACGWLVSGLSAGGMKKDVFFGISSLMGASR